MIWFAGDPHGFFDHIPRAIDIAVVKPSAVILLGDIEAPMPLSIHMREVEERGVKWAWIVGNHDTDHLESYENLSDPASLEHCLDSQVMMIDGLRVAGLGGVFREEIWYPQNGSLPKFENYSEYERFVRMNRSLKGRLSRQDIVQTQAVPPESRQWNSQLLDRSRSGKLLKHRSSIFPNNYERLMCERADVLVTHEAPSCHKYGFDAIDNLAASMGVKRLFHGHHHRTTDYSDEFAVLGFEAYSVGLCGIVDLNGRVIHPGERG